MKPVYAHKALIGADGQIVHNAIGQPVIVRDYLKEFHINWPGYLCFAGAAVSLLWTLCLVALRSMAFLQGRGAADDDSRSTELESYIPWRKQKRETKKAAQVDGPSRR